MTAGPARSIGRAGGLRRPFALRGRRGPCAPRWGRGATEQEQSDHEAHRTGDHKDHARGLDREPGHGRFNCKHQDRTKRDQEYRCSDRHRSHLPGTVGNKRGRLAGTSFLGRANLGSSLPSCLLGLRGLIGRAPICVAWSSPGTGRIRVLSNLWGGELNGWEDRSSQGPRQGRCWRPYRQQAAQGQGPRRLATGTAKKKAGRAADKVKKTLD